jgi:hypothetical protein
MHSSRSYLVKINACHSYICLVDPTAESFLLCRRATSASTRACCCVVRLPSRGPGEHVHHVPAVDAVGNHI